MREIVMRCQHCGTQFTLFADPQRGPPWSEEAIRSIVRERFPLKQVQCSHCRRSQALSSNLEQVGRLSIVSNIGFPSNEELVARDLIAEILRLRAVLGPICNEGFLHLLKLVWETYGATHDVTGDARLWAIYTLYGNHSHEPDQGNDFFQPLVGQLAGQFSGDFTQSAMPGFCVFTRVIPLTALVTRRIYVNLNPSRCFSAIKAVFRLLRSRNTVHSFKFCSAMSGMATRSDNLVIYLTDNSEETLIVTALGLLSSQFFRERLPRMTLRVAHGVSIGAEPLMLGVDFGASHQNQLVLHAVAQQSFGKFRCEVILCALNHCGGNRILFYQLVRLFFVQAGLDPMRPHD